MNSEQRDIKRLLKISIDHIDQYFEFGLCGYIITLVEHKIITKIESDVLMNYLEQHKPDNRWTRKKHDYWWSPCDIYWRRLFLTKLLNNLNKL